MKTTTRKPRQLLLAASIATALAAPTALLAGDIQARIVGGQPADNGEYPFMVALMSQGSQFCGGSLIAANWVLTAAHCVEDGSANGLQVMVGSNRLNSGGQRIDAKRVIVHQDYASQGTPDVALIELQQNASSEPVKLLEPGTGLESSGQTATVIGWGTTSEGGNGSNQLLEVDVPIVDGAICSQAYGGQVNTSHELCAGLAQGGKDSCQGDSGGPLFVRNATGDFLQAGVVSWGDGCARPGKYGIYAKVSAQVDWITSQTSASSGGGEPGDGGGDGGGDNPGNGDDNGQVAANFSVNCDALACSFDASSSNGDIYAYYWDFGDAQGWDMGRKVNYQYGVDGSYDVTLTVVTSDYDVADSTQTITVSAGGDNGGEPGGSGTGYLNGAGDYTFEPGEPMQLNKGDVIIGQLSGAAGTDFDLYLERYKPRTDSWKLLRASESLDSDERIRFKVRRSGLYQWVVSSYEGAGSYDFEMEVR